MRFHRSMRTYQDASQHLLNPTGIPDLESYIYLRRDASGFRMVFDLIEYAGGLNLPEHALVHPILKHLIEQACDIIAWSEVRFGLRNQLLVLQIDVCSALGCCFLCSRHILKFKHKPKPQHRHCPDEGTQMFTRECTRACGHARQAERGIFSCD